MDVSAYLAQIEEVFASPVAEFAVHDGGDDFVVIEVNGAWMFRFPRNETVQRALRCEIEFLPRFAALSPLPVPQFEYVGDGFVGYPKIAGELLTIELLRTLGPDARARIARQMGESLSALHSFPLAEARGMGVTEGWGGWREAARRRFEHQVAPLLTSSVAQEALALLDQVMALEWEPVLIHGDFYPPDHLFFDLKRQELCGIIDFGDLTIEDAATDLGNILELNAGLFQDVMCHYSGSADAGLVDRIRLRRKATPLFDASYAVEYGFRDRLQTCLLAIEGVLGDGLEGGGNA